MGFDIEFQILKALNLEAPVSENPKTLDNLPDGHADALEIHMELITELV